MANQDLALRFTNDLYATKSDVSKALNTSMVDAIWQNILQYRSLFAIPLPIQTITKQPLTLHLTPVILEQIQRVERKLTKILGYFSSLQTLDRIPLNFSPQLLPVLTPLADHYGASHAQRHLMAIIEGKEDVRSPELTFVARYFTTLNSLASRRQTRLDEDFFGDMLVSLMGHDNLTSFYREKELTNRPRSLIGKVYESAPFSMVESMMHQLLAWVSSSTLSPIIVATVTLFYMNYVKPFEFYNDELSFLSFKNILIHSDYEMTPLFLAIEACIENEAFELKLLEVQKTFDLTYLLDYMLPILEQSLLLVLDGCVHLDRTMLTTEQRSPIKIPAPHIPSTSIPTTLPASGLQHPLDEELEAKRIQEDLLITHPDMKQLEAFFYARHRVIGKFYTIALFKQKTGCAYETARTSMEHLVKLGYYRKEPFKNKFVYTPVNTLGE
jgi:hypothetical protein